MGKALPMSSTISRDGNHNVRRPAERITDRFIYSSNRRHDQNELLDGLLDSEKGNKFKIQIFLKSDNFDHSENSQISVFKFSTRWYKQFILITHYLSPTLARDGNSFLHIVTRTMYMVIKCRSATTNSFEAMKLEKVLKR